VGHLRAVAFIWLLEPAVDSEVCTTSPSCYYFDMEPGGSGRMLIL